MNCNFVSEEHKIEEEGISYRKVFIHCAQERSKRFRRSAMGKIFVKGRERSQDCDPLENIDLIIQNELIFEFDLCYLFLIFF